jgi:hypothetical protein
MLLTLLLICLASAATIDTAAVVVGRLSRR